MKNHARHSDQPKKRKFTLIELLIVIAIITILSSMLLPVLGRARNFSKRIFCVNNFRQIFYGTVNYQDSNNEFICNGNIRGNLFSETVGQYWKDRIGYYISGNPKGTFSSSKIKTFDCPSEPKPEDFPYKCYGPNATFTGVEWKADGYMRKVSAVTKPSKLLYVAEAGGNAYRVDSANWWYFRHGPLYMKNPGMLNFGLYAKTNAMYFDGHVEIMSQPDSRKVDFWAGYNDARVLYN